MAGAESLRAETVGEGTTGAPDGVLVRVVELDLLGHLVEDLIEEWVRVHEHETRVLAGEAANEGAGVSEGN